MDPKINLLPKDPNAIPPEPIHEDYIAQNPQKHYVKLLLLVITALLVFMGMYAVWSYFVENQKSKPLTATLPMTTPSPTQTAIVETQLPDTTNWKTFKKDSLWEIKYPSEWKIDENTVNVIFSDGYGAIIENRQKGNISISIEWTEDPSDYDGIFASEVGAVETGKNKITILNKFQINNYDAIRTRVEPFPESSATKFYQEMVYIKGPLGVVISAADLHFTQPPSKAYLDLLPVFDQMLSTFKFLE